MNIHRPKRPQAFTLIEMLTVITIILILAAILLNVAGYVNNKAATSRAEGEIHAISLALESYKADNGIYPQDGGTDALNAKANFDPTAADYQASGRTLYRELTGDNDNDPTNPVPVAVSRKQYMEIKSNMLPTGTSVYIQDPFGNSYGYSTAYQADLKASSNPPTRGYNPSFDLWSTSGGKASADQPKWIKNW